MQRSRQVVPVALEWERQLENALGQHAQAAQPAAEHDPSHDGGGAAAQPATNRDGVAHANFEPAERTAPSAEGLLRSAQDEIAPVERDFGCAGAFPSNCSLFRLPAFDLEIEIEGESEDVEARSQVRR